MSNILNNYNPKFINNYFKSLTILFFNDNNKNNVNINLIYKEYLKDEENNFYKYFNGLLYCLNYLQCLFEKRYPHRVNKEYKIFKEKVINRYIECYNMKQLKKSDIEFIITTFNKVNELYSDIE